MVVQTLMVLHTAELKKMIRLINSYDQSIKIWETFDMVVLSLKA